VIDLNGKIAIVTGGTRGIGAAIVEMCAGLGAQVVFTGRDEAAGSRVVESCGNGAQVRFLQGDVTGPGFPDRLTEDVLGREGRIDILVNNAGILSRGDVVDCTEAEWNAVMETNVTAMFRLCRAVVPIMRRQFQESGQPASIVNIASDWALVAAVNALAYGASNGAVAQLTRSLAADHAKDGIRVNAVCPGDTETEMLLSERGDAPTAAVLADLGKALPLGRVGKPEEIAAAVAFLASDQAAYITGIMLPVDGGHTAW
jgi:meso-butanediol dehydrogenase/(S,S)-butanediol dehydrogenase/diacetyl reductase